jgi:hypothetical protein
MEIEMDLKPGTRIETLGFPAIGGFGAVALERATIKRWNEKISGPRAAVPGYHRVKFASDGGEILMCESSFRVVDNR